MPESPLIEKEIAAIADLEALVAARAKGETETELAFHRRREREEQEYRSAAAKLASRYKTDKEALEAEYQKVRDQILETFKREAASVEAEYSQVKQKIDAQAKNDRSRAKKAQEETRWQALAMYEAGRDGAVKSRKQDEETLAVTRGNFEEIHAVAQEVMRRYKRLAGPEPTSPVQAVPAANADAEIQPQAEPTDSTQEQRPSQVLTLQEAVKQADTELLALESLKLASFL